MGVNLMACTKQIGHSCGQILRTSVELAHCQSSSSFFDYYDYYDMKVFLSFVYYRPNLQTF